jgi:hypothetical protein
VRNSGHALRPWPRHGIAYTDASYVGGATLEQVDVCFCASVKSPRAVTTRRDMIGTTAWSWQGIFAAAVRGAAERPPELVVNS